MLHLRVFGAAPMMERVAESVSALAGADHVTRTDAGDSAGRTLVTADVDPDAADAALRALTSLGVPAEDVWLLRLEGLQPGRRRPRQRGSAMVWADLLGQAGEHARPVGRFLMLMAVAGIIAAYGVIYSNGILVAGALTEFLDLVDLLPSSFQVGENGLAGLTTVNSSTVVVAFVAGIAGILALETRAGAAVGVAISVTTIPASAYLGVAAGMGEVSKASGALAVLGINVAMLLVGGSLTLVTQEALTRRRAA